MPCGIDEKGGYNTAHFWTLAIEEHFYLLCPLALVFFPRHAARLALLLIGVFACWRVLVPTVMGDTRMDGLLWGALAAIHFPIIKRLHRRWAVPHLSLWLAGLLVLARALMGLSPVGMFG